MPHFADSLTVDDVSELALPPRPSLPVPATTMGNPARPLNLTRIGFHVIWGGFALALIRLLPSRTELLWTGGTFIACAWACELARHLNPNINKVVMRAFGPVAHPSEWHRVNSATWYSTALFILAALAPLRAAEIGVLVLAVADPAAGAIGRRFGQVSVGHKKSLEGSVAFFVIGAIASLVWLSVFYDLSRDRALTIALGAPLAGALAELRAGKLDDNLVVPLVTAAAAAILWLI